MVSKKLRGQATEVLFAPFLNVESKAYLRVVLETILENGYTGGWGSQKLYSYTIPFVYSESKGGAGFVRHCPFHFLQEL